MSYFGSKEWSEKMDHDERINKYWKHKQEAKQKKLEKAKVVKDGQESICRFVKIRFQEYKRKTNGGYIHTGQEDKCGLQVSNKVFLLNGHFKYINNKGVKIVKKYEGIPDWATQELIDMYNKNKK